MPKLMTQLSATILVLMAIGAGAANSGPIADKAAEIETKIGAGDMADAVRAGRDLTGQIWDQAKEIGFTEALLVAEPASGFGIYNPRPTNSYKKGEKIVVYVEPFGLTYAKPADGLYTLSFHVDLKVLSEKGELLGDIPNLTEFNQTSRSPNHEVQANLTYTLDGIPAGKYVLQTTLRDKNSDRSGSFQTQIELVE